MRSPVFALLLLLAANTAQAANAPGGAAPMGTGPAAYGPDASLVTGFSGPDQWIIPRYFERLREDQIRAKASRKKMARGLPGDIEVRPVKGAMLPTGAERQSLPTALTRDLPRLPAGLQRLVIAQDVVLVRSDGLVIDVMADVVH